MRLTLESLGKINVPPGWSVELLVVDNGSTDHTRTIASKASLRNMNLRYVSEPKAGQSIARNTGILAARGEIIVFTDDDVSPAPDWLGKMVEPMAKKNK